MQKMPCTYQNFEHQYEAALHLLAKNPWKYVVLFLQKNDLTEFRLLDNENSLLPLVAIHPINSSDKEKFRMDPVDILIKYMKEGFSAYDSSENAVFGDDDFQYPLTCYRSAKKGFTGDKLYLNIHRGVIEPREPEIFNGKNKVRIESASPDNMMGVMEMGHIDIRNSKEEMRSRMKYLKNYYTLAEERIKFAEFH